MCLLKYLPNPFASQYPHCHCPKSSHHYPLPRLLRKFANRSFASNLFLFQSIFHTTVRGNFSELRIMRFLQLKASMATYCSSIKSKLLTIDYKTQFLLTSLDLSLFAGFLILTDAVILIFFFPNFLKHILFLGLLHIDILPRIFSPNLNLTSFYSSSETQNGYHFNQEAP